LFHICFFCTLSHIRFISLKKVNNYSQANIIKRLGEKNKIKNKLLQGMF
jgi:heme O synthase-like polyprenyltransferase